MDIKKYFAYVFDGSVLDPDIIDCICGIGYGFGVRFVILNYVVLFIFLNIIHNKL